MIVNERIPISIYCIVIQHGYHCFCRLIPKGAVATQEKVWNYQSEMLKCFVCFFREQLVKMVFVEMEEAKEML